MIIKILILLLITECFLQASQNLKILIVGSGGREHALAWKVAQSPCVSKVYVAPGNPGTAFEKNVENITIPHDQLHLFAKNQNINLTIIGPEAPLAAGIVDLFEEHGLRCCGPKKAAARLESSKSFAKEFMIRHNIPTASYRSFNNYAQAAHYIQQQSLPLVIKADGLAAGKGVIVAYTQEEALQAAYDMLVARAFGDAGATIIIEEFLEGEEVTFIVMTDGTHILPLASAQDYKKLYDGDHGPNTGGMGAYSPVPIITDALHNRIMHEIIEPTIAGMAHDGNPYCGFLYAGLMINSRGEPKVLEFNCRLGDPEAQPILMRLQSDVVQLCNAALDHTLHTVTLEWSSQAAVTVVLASEGYPNSYVKNVPITGLSQQTQLDSKIFHAATALHNNQLVTAGGRVLCVTALGDTIQQAHKKAYEIVETISFTNMIYRTDIGSHK